MKKAHDIVDPRGRKGILLRLVFPRSCVFCDSLGMLIPSSGFLVEKVYQGLLRREEGVKSKSAYFFLTAV